MNGQKFHGRGACRAFLIFVLLFGLSRGVRADSVAAADRGLGVGAQELSLSAGPGFGLKIITSKTTHDWGAMRLDYGWVFSDVVAADKWYRGNWEFMVEVFGGGQYYPERAYFIGGGPILRYNFATQSRWVPFLDFGGGATATDIRSGAISTTFEFNLQAGGGTHYFLRDNLALTFEYRLVHLSNAGIKFPNLGVNTGTFYTGISCFF